VFRKAGRVALLVMVASMGANAANTHAGEQETHSRPNVLFIVCDDLNDAVEGMGGHPQGLTPHLDRLADYSVRFRNAHSNDPVCGPSRASFLTGIYPHVSGYYGYAQGKNRWNHNPVLKEAVTIFEHFSDHGYDVHATGKLFHHRTPEVYVRDDGFDGYSHLPWDFGPWVFDGQKKTGHPDSPEVFLNGKWPQFVTFASLANTPAFEADAEAGVPGYRGWVHGDESPFHYASESDRDLMPDEVHARWAAELLSREHEAPFFISVGFHRPHSPWYAPDKFFAMHPLESIQLPPYREDDLEDTAAMLGVYSYPAYQMAATRFTRWRDSVDDPEQFEQEWKRFIQAYLACVSFVDAQIGKVFDALANSPHADNTIVVVTSDHGYHMGEKDRIWKRTMWEESTRVPLFIHAPGLSADGGDCAKPVSLIDLYPTLADLCGLPGDPNAGKPFALGGHSLRGLLADPVAGTWDGPDVALSAIAGPVDPGHNQPGEIRHQHFSVRSERYRYIRALDGEEELYDHQQDPNEWHNLADDMPTSE